MRLLCLAGGAVLGLIGSATMAAENEWVCVPGEAGRWRCGHDERALEAVPLAEADSRAEPGFIPTESPYSKPRMPWQPQASDIAQRRPPPGASLQAPGAVPQDPAPGASLPDSYVLQLVSVSSAQDVNAFVEDFAMDPSQVRYARITEDGSERFLIVYGGYNSQQQARLAITALPAAMRSIQPQPVATNSFENPLDRLQEISLDSKPQSTSIAASDTPADASPVSENQARPEKLTLADAQQPPVDAETPEIELIETELDGVVETSSLPDPKPVAIESSAIDEGTGSKLPETSVSSGVAETPARSVEWLPVASSQNATPAESAPVLDRPVQPPEQRTVSVAVAPQPKAQPNTVQQPVAAKVTAPAGNKTPFNAIDPNYFTLQLSSQRTEESAARFITRHGLDRSRLHLVLIDEGAGARWLILYSEFPDLETADTSKYLIPPAIRSPWARRIAPLQQNMIRSM